MLFALSSALYRQGRVVVAVAVLVALCGAAVMAGSEAYRDTVGAGLFGVMVVAFGLSLAVLHGVNRRAPRTLDRTADGFTTPRHGGSVLMVASTFPMIGIGIAAGAIEVTSGRHVVLGAAAAVAGLGLVAWLAALLRTVPSVDLTPRGLTAIRLASSIAVPWEALDPERPVVREDPPTPPKLVVARPDLVERRGVTGRSDAIGAEGVPLDFLLGAIGVYAADPARRAAIGTADELDRLRAELPAPAPVPLADRPVREPGVTRTGVVVRVLVIAAALAAEAATERWWLRLPAQLVAGALAIDLGARVHPITWIRQRLTR